MADRRAWAGLWFATVALFCVHLWIATRIAGPTVAFDENGYLGTARWLTGGAEWRMPPSPFYAVGYSLVIAPATLLTTASAQWLAVGVIDAALAASVLPLLALVLRRLVGASPRRAAAGAAVGAIAPAVLVSGASARADTLALPLVLLLVLAGSDALDRDRRGWRRVLVGPATAALLLTHSRYWPAVIVVVVALLLASRRRADRPIALANLGLLALGIVGGQVLSQAARSARWTVVERPEGSVSDLWPMLQSLDGLRELAVTAIGQAWYLGVGSLGLAFVGIVLAGQKAVGRSRWTHERVLSTAIVTCAAGVFGLSVVFFAQNQFRADHYVYGRHNDSFAPVWIGLAIVHLLGQGRDRVWRLVGSAAAVAGLGGALVLLRDAAPGVTGFGEFAVPALVRMTSDDLTTTFVRATAIATVCSLALAGVIAWAQRLPADRRAFATRAGLVAVSLGLVWIGLGAIERTRSFSEDQSSMWSVDVFERLRINALCIDIAAGGNRPTLRYPWALPSVDARMYDGRVGEEPDCTYALARLDDPARIAAGDRIAALDQGGVDTYFAPDGLALWVAPGAEAERLAELGALLPEGFPTDLPPDARAADIEIVDPPTEPVIVAPGGSTPLAARVTHAGSGAPWPDNESYGLRGRVRVVTLITPLDEDGVLGARSGGELPQWMWPGDTSTVDLEVFAVDEALTPLPPGHYAVQLGIAQEGSTWVTPGGADARFELEVRT